MDFALIERHPWTTTGIVLGGGVLLFLVMRRGSTSAPAASAPQYAAGGIDPQTAQLNAQSQAQQTQMQTYIAGLQLQGATQISLAQIGADVSRFTTGATAETIDTQTNAQLSLGIHTQDAVTEQTRINAGLQSRYIDAIVAAFSANRSPSTIENPVVTPTPGSNNPTVQFTPPVSVQIPVGTGTGGYYPVTTGGVNPGTSFSGDGSDPNAIWRQGTGAVVPGGYSAGGPVAQPSYANCNPRDVACVLHNQQSSIDYNISVGNARTADIHAHCLADAELNRGYPNYGALVAACGA